MKIPLSYSCHIEILILEVFDFLIFIFISGDECLMEGWRCDDNAHCINNGTSFECKCNDGYTGTGFKCEGTVTLFDSFALCKKFLLSALTSEGILPALPFRSFPYLL